MSKAKQHLYSALNAMGASVPSAKLDLRDEIIAAQDVALTLDEEDRIAVCKITTLLRTRQAAIDRIYEAWAKSVEQIKLAIHELEAQPAEPPYGTPEWTAAVDAHQRSTSKKMAEIRSQ